MAKKLKPVHPGEILREEFLEPLSLAMNALALALRVPVTRVADIAKERRGITADTALRLARYFNNAPVFWTNLQTRHDLAVADDEISSAATFARSKPVPALSYIFFLFFSALSVLFPPCSLC